MGLLTGGSGAAFSSAAFNNSVNATSDMRVLVDNDQLTVEPGILFRDGTTSTDTFDPGAAGPGPNGTSLYDYSSNDLFGGVSNDGLSAIGAGDVPAVGISNDENGAITLQVATKTQTNSAIGDASEGVLQIRNDTADPQDIAIRYTFGADAGSVGESNIVDIFEFKDGTNNARISTDDPTTAPQTVDNVVTVAAGTVEQIYIDYDTDTNSTAIEGAAGYGGSANPFTQTDTVQLIKNISVGIEDGNDVSP